MFQERKQITIEFENIAAEIYSSFFRQFSISVSRLNRKTDENVYQLQVAKFSALLKHSLESRANKISQHTRDSNDAGFQRVLSAKIDYYLREFRNKCNAL